MTTYLAAGFLGGLFVGFISGWVSLAVFLKQQWRWDSEEELRALRRDIKAGRYPD